MNSRQKAIYNRIKGRRVERTSLHHGKGLSHTLFKAIQGHEKLGPEHKVIESAKDSRSPEYRKMSKQDFFKKYPEWDIN